MNETLIERQSEGTTTSLSAAQARERVYFVQAENGGPIKIGKATDVERRVADLQRTNPFTLRVLAVAEGGSTLETQLHQRFASDRKHNEWFEPSRELMRLISDYASAGEAPQRNKIVQHNMRVPESARDLLHELCRRLRHEEGFEDTLRSFISNEAGKSKVGQLEERLRLIEERLDTLER
jgi:hypothetical protein